jgi:hypothetical protein
MRHTSIRTNLEQRLLLKRLGKAAASLACYGMDEEEVSLYEWKTLDLASSKQDGLLRANGKAASFVRGNI